MDIFSYTIYGNSLKDYLVALIIFASVFVGLRVIKYILSFVLRKIFARFEAEIGDLVMRIVNRIGSPLFLLAALYIALQFIQVPDRVSTVLGYALMILTTVYVGLSLQYVVDYIIHRVMVKREEGAEGKEEFESPIISLISIVAKIALWVIAFIFILSNMGYNVTTLVAGFGIGGLVIAFGLQKVMQDLFASFSIYIDKPFAPGDFIIIGDDLGVVKKIGIKSTRIQHLGGQELVVSNRELTDIRIHNYTRMQKRRIAFTFGVVYQTPAEKLERIPEMIKEIIANVETAEIDRVHFKQYADFSLNFEVVYYVITPDYAMYMDTQQRINLAMKKKFKQEGIEFAYPTQTLFVQKEFE